MSQDGSPSNGGLTRRQFLKITSAGAAALMLPWSLEACSDDGEKAAHFFTSEERATVQAATARIVPTDATPGAIEAGAVDYIERLLTAFDHEPPVIFAGGPFSGRAPYPDSDTGQPSDDVPDNEFRKLLPLTRTQEIAWRARLFGSANVPGAGFNDALLGPTKGFRDLYRDGIAALDAKSQELSGKPFVELTPEEQDAVLADTDVAEFAQRLIAHTLEGTYCAPEYGGNKGLVSWTASGWDGDSQPLGYSIYNKTTGSYNELPDKPNSKPNPGETNTPLQGDPLDLLQGIVAGIGGKRFF